VTSGSVTFKGATPIDPTVDFSFDGMLHALPFRASIFGPLSHRIALIDSEEARQILLGLSPAVADPLKAAEKPDPQRPVLIPWRPVEPPAATPAPAKTPASPPPAAPAASAPPIAALPPVPAPGATPEAKP
jgi:hypothetical protein